MLLLFELVVGIGGVGEVGDRLKCRILMSSSFDRRLLEFLFGGSGGREAKFEVMLEVGAIMALT